MHRENAAATSLELDMSREYITKTAALLSKSAPLYSLITYGCQMNEHDSETLSGMLEEMGYAPAEGAPADLIIFNTCCVREHAEQRVYGNIGSLRQYKEERPDAIIAVCGCMMQQDGAADALLKRFPFVNIAFGTNNITDFPKLVYDALSGRRSMAIGGGDRVLEGMPVKRKSGPLGWLSIMFGCDNYCSYCIVPYVRGRERSRSMEAILEEARQLCNDGCREITLLGQNVNSYGRDNDEDNFARLLWELSETKGLERIRFMTSHPKDLSDELIEVIAVSDKVCPQLHLPVQSGSDAVLAAMNRGYTSDHYRALIEKLRKAVPNIGLTTDVIVGFPGETDADFADTLSLMRDIRFHAAYTFKYSKRSGTAAANMAHQVPSVEKSARLKELNALQKLITAEIQASYIGREYDLLIEGPAKKEGQVCGKTGCGRTVNIMSADTKPGDIVRVIIDKAGANTLNGRLI
ncbi:MAG: tRNA (N6-isopentenyl adenosine(37)-C2)-methylthiotransferase MiaB [Christensenellales bacterium]|jgi:tRNA-2-methylthio-N6-dimethylallyladenosine synthase